MVDKRILIPITAGFFLLFLTVSKNTASRPKLPVAPEKALANVDGKRAPGAEKPYAQLLDKLKPKCYEDRETLAIIVHATTKKIKPHVAGSDNLDTLATLNSMADHFDNGIGNCHQLASYLAESTKSDE